MPSDRSEWPRDDRDNPYNRQREDRPERRRDRSRSRERDREWAYDRGRERSSPRRRSPSREREYREDKTGPRSHTRSPPSRDERDRNWLPSPRNEGRSRGSSRSRSPPKRRPTSPAVNDSQRYRREYPAGPARPGPYHESVQGGFEYGGLMRGRGGWRGSSYPYPSRGGYPPRQYDAPYIRDQNDGHMSRGPPPGPYNTPFATQNPELSISPPSGPSAVTPGQSSGDPSATSAPTGPASWRRAQQYKQDRPYQQDYRPNFPAPRGGPPVNPISRTSPHTPYSQRQSPIQSPNERPPSTSPTLNRPIPTGPRALVPVRQLEIPVKKEYISPVPDLDEKLSKLKSDYEKLEAKDWDIQKRKRTALAEWTFLDRESKREAAKVEMAEKLLEATVNGNVFIT